MIKNLLRSKALLFYVFVFSVFQVSSQEWTYKKGQNVVNVYGNYGVIGITVNSNHPGSRDGGLTWTDNSGGLWMFGGNGYGTSSFGRLHDLWKYDPATNNWTWIHGTSSTDQIGVYGLQGVPSVINYPGSRAYSVTWTDNSGNLWLFGGEGYDAFGTFGNLNDLWRYNPLTNVWTWMSGSSLANQIGAYGTQGVASGTNIPGARRLHTGWKDNSGNFWLFGGYGYDNASSLDNLNDLWKYDPVANTWAWMKGNSAANQAGTYGVQGTANPANNPGARHGAESWKDNSGNLFLFSGNGQSSAGGGFLNDIWKYNIGTNQWTWMKGSNLANPLSQMSAQSISSATAAPGGRYFTSVWVDNNNNMYTQGGYGLTLGGAQQLNDTWKYNSNSNEWTYVRGVNWEIAGNYGTQGSPAITNDPGSGHLRMSWTDNSANFWLFGGNAYDVNSNFGALADLWVMNSCVPGAPINVSAFGGQNSCTGMTTTLSAVSGTNAITWYSALTGTPVVGTGTTYITPPLTSGTMATNSFTYYAASSNTCGPSLVRTPVVATSNSIYPVVTTGKIYTVGIALPNGSTPNSSFAPWEFFFTDPVPPGGIIIGMDLSCDVVDQGWGGSGASADMIVADMSIGTPVLQHWSQHHDFVKTTPFPNYIYGGTNVFRMYFVGWSGWQGFINNGFITVRYQTKNPPAEDVCENINLTLKGYGAVTYSWSGGALDGVPALPTSTQIYTVTGKNAYGCADNATLQVNVIPSPTVTVAGSNTLICKGIAVTQTASIAGASHSFSWNTGALTNAINTTPTITTNYVATAMNTLTGCSDSYYRKVIVKSNPQINVSATTNTMCQGLSSTLSLTASSSPYALNFDGVDDFVETGNSITEFGKGDFTIEAWVKTTGVSMGIVTCENSNFGWDMGEKCFFIDGSGIPSFVGHTNDYISGNLAVNDGLWHHVAVVWDYSTGIAGTGKIYIDGIDRTGGVNFHASTFNQGTVKIGATSYGSEAPNNFVGNIDDVRIWNTARLVGQISGNMNSCLNGSEPGLVSYYKFEDGPGSSMLADLGNFDYHGTLINMDNDLAWVTGNTNCSAPLTAYSWMPGSLTTTAITVAPLSTTVYTVTATNNQSCFGSAHQTITINPLPVISVNSGQICIGNSYSITPTGANTYTYLSGSSLVSPTLTSSYSITGTSIFGCEAAAPAISTVTVNSLPVLSVAGSPTVCYGSAVSQTVSGASTYTWNTGPTSAIVSLTPLTTSDYTVTGLNSITGCSATAVKSITVHALPVVTVNSGSICSGTIFTISPSGALSYTYTGGSNTVSPPSTANYSVTGSNGFGCISIPVISNVLVRATPTINLNSGAICIGNSFTINPSGASTYTFLNGSSVVSPTSTSSYSVTGTSTAGCVSFNPGISNITVNPLPVLSISGPSAVCSGSAITQTAGGATSYSWNTGATSTVISISPTVLTVYNLSGTISATGCFASVSKVINIGTPPVINVNSGNICAGAPFVMVPGGASTYTFSNGTTTVLSTVSPTANTSYFVSGTSTLGCVSTTSAIANVIINPAPVIVVNSGGICAGNVFTMNPTGASTYTFSNGSSTVLPVSNGTYAVTGTDVLGCVSSAPGIASVTVNSLPTITASSATICSGGYFNITPVGASTYTFVSQTGPVTSWVTPTITTTYSVTGTSAQGCISPAAALVQVSVAPLPTITVNSGTVCSGSIFTLSPSGADTYTYSSGVSTVVPMANTSYSVMGTNTLGCISANAAVANVTLVAAPFITVNSGTICSGKEFIMVPSGASTYTYSSLSATVSPLSNTTYTVNGTNAFGCLSVNSALAQVLVNPTPSLGLMGIPVICAGKTTSIIATGAVSYTWSNNSSSALQVFSPSATTSYSVSGENSYGCVNTTSVSVTVNPLPTISLNTGTICPLSNFTLIPSGALTYTFSSGANVVAPAVTTSYSVVGKDANGCVSAGPGITTVTVINDIAISLAGNTVVCEGAMATLSVSGANEYMWSNGNTANIISLSPTVTTSYSVVGANGTCKDTAFVSILVNTLPTVTATTASSLICAGDLVLLNSGGAVSYTWDSGTNTTTLAVSPSVTTIYTLTGTDANGCTNKSTLTQLVKDCVGLNELTQNLSVINLYPNPNNGEFFIETSQFIKVVVTNSLGQFILEKDLQAGRNEMFLNEAAKGIYFVQFKDGNHSKTVRVIKQ